MPRGGSPRSYVRGAGGRMLPPRCRPAVAVALGRPSRERVVWSGESRRPRRVCRKCSHTPAELGFRVVHRGLARDLHVRHGPRAYVGPSGSLLSPASWRRRSPPTPTVVSALPSSPGGVVAAGRTRRTSGGQF